MPHFSRFGWERTTYWSNAIGGGNDPANPLTPVAAFAGSLQGTLAALTANGAKGAVANIPDVTEAPFFHTIPYNALALDQANADALNAAYYPLNQLIKSLESDDTLVFRCRPEPACDPGCFISLGNAPDQQQ